MGILDDKNVLKLIMAMVMPSENILKNTDWKKHSPKKDSECHSLGQITSPGPMNYGQRREVKFCEMSASVSMWMEG